MLLSVNEARVKLLEALPLMGVEEVLIPKVAGRILADDIYSSIDLPPFPNSSMDGFAVISKDVLNASEENPISLRVVADIPAGTPPEIELKSGQTARIMTGAPLPKGAEAVVPVEGTDFNNRDAGTAPPDDVDIMQSVRKGDYIRPQGQDIAAGQKVLSTGTRIRPQEIGMIAMLGMGKIPVFSKPKVAILSTGDELIPVGREHEPGKIFESNAYTLAALVADVGGEPIRLGIAKDQSQDVQRRLDEGVDKGVDLIVSSAGVSVGAFDFVREVVERHGSISFWRVNMRPGKPLAFGNYRGVPFIGLPGNPVSSFVGFEVFVRPALIKMLGWKYWKRNTLRAVLSESIHSDGRESYLRGVVAEEGDERVVRLTGHQGSGNQFSLVQANGLIVVPAGVKSLLAGVEVEIWPL